MRKMLFTLHVGILGGFILAGSLNNGLAQTNYRIFVSNEKSGDISVINGGDFQLIKTIPVGKRPRGIQASPDGKTLYVALSGTPVEPPPQLDANDNPILQKHRKDDDNEIKAEKAADGIGVVDLTTDKFLRKIPAGSDPAQFALSLDGRRLYVANEDVGTTSVIDIATGKIITFIPVAPVPEGISVSPDGKFFYVGCESSGDIFAIDTTHFNVIGQIKVNPQPHSIEFLPDGSKAYAPSESPGEINVLDTRNHTLTNAIALPKDCRPRCIKVSADGKRVYASTGPAGTVCVIDTALEQVVDNIKVDKSPWGVALSPDGKFLFAANGPSDDVSVVDLAIGKEVVRVKLGAGSSPWSIVVVTTVK
jgi:YVTN family beta-propeller protein